MLSSPSSTSSSEPGRRPRAGARRAGSAALNVLVFLVAGWASARALHFALPELDTGLAQAKLERFSENKDDFDTLFFGSSRAYRGFVPELFDRLNAENGIQTRSFNFGLPAARSMEIHYVLGELRRMQPANLRWIFVDPEGLGAFGRGRSQLARQVIVWHDPETTWLVARHILDSDRAFADRMAAIYEHALACGYRAANFGRGQVWVDRILGRKLRERIDEERLGPLRDGFWPLTVDDSEHREHKKQRFQDDPARYLKRVKNMHGDVVPESDVPASSLVFFLRLAQRIEELGAIPVFVMQPAMYHNEELVNAQRSGAVEHLLRYDDPGRFPALYDLDNRWDNWHLNSDGAHAFTRLLAEDFSALAGKDE